MRQKSDASETTRKAETLILTNRLPKGLPPTTALKSHGAAVIHCRYTLNHRKRLRD